MISLAELLERLGPLLDASGARHWSPVLTALVVNCDGWHVAHSGSGAADPAYSELAHVIEFYNSITHVQGEQGRFEPADDIALAAALAETDFARRTAVLPATAMGGPVLRWSIFDAPFSDFMEEAAHYGFAGAVRTSYDVLRPASRLRDELLGRMLVARSQAA